MNECVGVESVRERKRKRKRSRRRKREKERKTRKKGEEGCRFFLCQRQTENRRGKRNERKKEKDDLRGGLFPFIVAVCLLCWVVLWCCRGRGPRRAKKRTGEEGKKGKAVELRGLVQQAQENEKKCSQGCSSVARVVLNRSLASGQTQVLRTTQCKRDKKRGVVRVCICMVYVHTIQHMLANRLLSKKRPLTLTNLFNGHHHSHGHVKERALIAWVK